MQILLLGNRSATMGTEQYYQQYLDFFEKAIACSGGRHQIVHALFEQLIVTVSTEHFSIRDACNNKELKEYDLVIIRGPLRAHLDIAKIVSTYLNDHAIPVVNDYSNFRSSSKITQAVQFHEFGLPIADTVLLSTAVLDRLTELPFSLPCIMKATYGAHGNHNFLVKDMAEIKKRVDENPTQEFVLQQYIPNDGDYRVLIVGEGILVIRRVAARGSHLNNTSQGGRAELVATNELPAALIEQCRHIVAHLGMTFAGVDVLFDSHTDDYVFLEVNSQPQLMSGAFIDEKIKLIGDFFRVLTSKSDRRTADS